MAKKNSKRHDIDYAHDLAYESLFDEANSMAYTLRKIETELHMAAACEGDYPGGYPSEQLLPMLCKIMFAAEGYHNLDKYTKRFKKSK